MSMRQIDLLKTGQTVVQGNSQSLVAASVWVCRLARHSEWLAGIALRVQVKLQRICKPLYLCATGSIWIFHRV